MTTRQEIEGWLTRGKDGGFDYCIVVVDGFDHEDYPVFATTKTYWVQHSEHNGKNMQRIMEVYDLNQPFGPQLDEYRAFNGPGSRSPQDDVLAPDRRGAVEATRAKNDAEV